MCSLSYCAALYKLGVAEESIEVFYRRKEGEKTVWIQKALKH